MRLRPSERGASNSISSPLRGSCLRGHRLVGVRGSDDRLSRVRLGPKGPGDANGVDPGSAPPCSFITRSVHLAMMTAAYRYDEFVAHLAPERAMLREPKMMGI